MKKLIDAVDDVVLDALRGMAAAHPSLQVDLDQRIIVRGDAPRTGKVGLVSGGGSGHEPLHGGFVGPGMLDAACPGEVLTSPVPDLILAATRAAAGAAGGAPRAPARGARAPRRPPAGRAATGRAAGGGAGAAAAASPAGG